MKGAWSPAEGAIGLNLVLFGGKMIIALLLLWAAGPQIAQEIAARAHVGWRAQGVFEIQERVPAIRARFEQKAAGALTAPPYKLFLMERPPFGAARFASNAVALHPNVRDTCGIGQNNQGWG
jgi:hypothetical protein